MSVVVLFLFLGFFYYLGSRLWSRRDGMQPQTATGPTPARDETTSFGAPRSATWQDQPRNTDDAA